MAQRPKARVKNLVVHSKHKDVTEKLFAQGAKLIRCFTVNVCAPRAYTRVHLGF